MTYKRNRLYKTSYVKISHIQGENKMPSGNGIVIHREVLHGCQVTTIETQAKRGMDELEEPVKKYITIHSGKRLDMLDDIFPVSDCLTELLDRVLQPYYQGRLCVCGVGNRHVPADALGQEVVSRLPLKVFSESGEKSNFDKVYSFNPGIEMNTNARVELLTRGVIKSLGVDCMLLVDSCMTEEAAKLFRTICITTGENTASYLAGRTADWSILGIPVISIGVPMAIPRPALAPEQTPCREMLTSVMAHDVVAAAGTIIACAIMRICWPNVSREDCFIPLWQ